MLPVKINLGVIDKEHITSLLDRISEVATNHPTVTCGYGRINDDDLPTITEQRTFPMGKSDRSQRLNEIKNVINKGSGGVSCILLEPLPTGLNSVIFSCSSNESTCPISYVLSGKDVFGLSDLDDKIVPPDEIAMKTLTDLNETVRGMLE